MATQTRPPKRDSSTSDLMAPSPTAPTSRSSSASQQPDFSRTSILERRTDSRLTNTTRNMTSRTARSTSRATTHVSSDIEAVIQCPICCDVMAYPKLLPCLHNVCKKCLNNYILSHLREEIQSDATPVSFPCPVCQEDIVPQTDLGCEKWASNFPTNFFLHTYGMIMPAQRENAMCDACSRRGEDSSAMWWCRECSEYLCNVCKTVHSGFKVFKNHSVISVKEIAENPDNALPNFDLCTEHTDKITHFCRDHKTPCCGICITTSHRKCDQIASVQEELDLLREQGEFTRIGILLGDYEETANDLIQQRKAIVTRLEDRRQEIVDKVKTVRKEFEESLRQLERKLLDDFDKFHLTEIFNLQTLTTRCENLGKQISNAVKLMETVQQSGSDVHMINLFGDVKRECNKYDTELKVNQQKLQKVDYEFHVDKSIENVIKTAKNIGNVNITRSKQSLQVLLESNQIIKGKLKEIARIRVSIAGDRGRCNITGGAYLNDGRIVLADFDNFKLKLFEEKGRILSKLQLKKKPSDLAVVNETTLAVTYPSASAIQFIDLTGNTMSEGTYIDTQRIYHSLSCSVDTLYLVSNSGIAVCDTDGKEIEFIKPENHGAPAFVRPSYIKATPGGIIVSDRERHLVIFLSRAGQVVQTFSAKDLSYPLGLDTDNQGNVFVCCKTSSNIHQFTEDGEKVKVILSEKDGDAENPHIIRFKKYHNKFFISESKISKRDYIRVFELS